MLNHWGNCCCSLIVSFKATTTLLNRRQYKIKVIIKTSLHFTYLNEAIFDLSNGQLKFDFIEHFKKPRVKSGCILKAKKENRNFFLKSFVRIFLNRRCLFISFTSWMLFYLGKLLFWDVIVFFVVVVLIRTTTCKVAFFNMTVKYWALIAQRWPQPPHQYSGYAVAWQRVLSVC